ncbi:protein MGARP isoform X2 [Elgaria multicarinata webbii]|uniref:protein MGARP isoform X2 n=1 Tax=Elgaria multicarinata webbii TaxID=159646 RepID=UPI002FCCD7D9
MYLCRVAWQTVASRLARAAPLLRGHVPFRQMSSGNVPGSSGENMIYYLFLFGAATTGGIYAYRTVTSDKARYNERINDMQQRNTAEWKPKPWPPQSLESDETDEVTEGSEEEKDADKETETVTTDESEVQHKTSTESTEVQSGEESPVEEASSSVQEEKDAASSSETAQTQETPEDGLDTQDLSPQEEIPEGTPPPAAQERPNTPVVDAEAVPESNGTG